MKNQTSRSVVAGVCISILLSCGMYTAAQEGGKQTPQAKEIKVFPVRHSDVSSVYQVVSDLMQDKNLRVTQDASTNSLIVHGYAVDLKVIERLVATLDNKDNAAGGQRFSEVLNVKDSTAQDIGAVLHAIFADKETKMPVRIAVNDSTNSLIITGQKKDVETASALVREFIARTSKTVESSQSSNYQIRVTWLVDTAGIDETGFFNEPNESLRALIDALQQEGSLLQAKTLTTNQTSVLVGTSPQFSSKNFTNTSLRYRNDGPVVLDVQGTVQGMAEGRMTLDISLKMSTGQSKLSIGTTVTLPVNHPVAFSISDVGNFKSAAVVEVLQSN